MGYVKAIAKDVGWQGNISAASNAFWEIKHVRDPFGHSVSRDQIYDPAIANYRYKFDEIYDSKVSGSLSVSRLRILISQCKWLNALFMHFLYLAEVPVISRIGAVAPGAKTPHSHRLEVPDPGEVPALSEWEAPASNQLLCEICSAPSPHA